MRSRAAVGDGVTWSPSMRRACLHLVSAGTVAGMAEHLGWSRRVCFLVLGTRGVMFLEVWPLVFGLLKALLTHGFPFATGTNLGSPFPLNAFCLVA